LLFLTFAVKKCHLSMPTFSVKHILALVICCCFGYAANAQDIHFSQYFSSPLTLNPALTGSFNADFRVAANFRTQYFKNDWNSNNATYMTYGASVDGSFFRKKLGPDQFGAGLQFYSDRAGDGGLSTTAISASIAYTKTVDKYERHSITLGMQGGIIQKRIDFTKLTFESQFNGVDGFNVGPNGENFTKSSMIYPDVSIGLLWRSRVGKKHNLYLGGAYSHLNSPTESFLGAENKLSPKITAHGGMEITLSKSISITPGFMVLSQNTASQINIGTALAYKLAETSYLYVGAWYRVGDAIIPMVGYEIKGFRAGFSFDVTTSDINLATNSKGAVELALVYTHNQDPPRSINPVKFCPKF
jgi:type IX secretion system PorP/SprF family membrane protein